MTFNYTPNKHRLTASAMQILHTLAARWELSPSDVLEVAVRQFAVLAEAPNQPGLEEAVSRARFLAERKRAFAELGMNAGTESGVLFSLLGDPTGKDLGGVLLNVLGDLTVEDLADLLELTSIDVGVRFLLFRLCQAFHCQDAATYLALIRKIEEEMGFCRPEETN